MNEQDKKMEVEKESKIFTACMAFPLLVLYF